MIGHVLYLPSGSIHTILFWIIRALTPCLVVWQGPGSQHRQNPYEADANFGKIVQGMEDVVARIHSVPQTGPLTADHQIKIIKMTIMIPNGDGGWMEWIDRNKQ
jgi:hypothetical protein